ncbi:MAG: glycosyltransferase family 39 protein [Planctomycetes bacterium]|nr:glycosyltransferase family 39 protein [Planctomycetota bacterium]
MAEDIPKPKRAIRADVLAYAVLTLGTLIGFSQALSCDFVNFDDPVYVTNNFDVQAGLCIDTIIWAFSPDTRLSAHWHPLTFLSLAVDHDIYGQRAWGFHLTNLLLHLANTLLLFRILHSSTGSVERSFVVAGLFAWHPLHVESVAWVTERKDVLSTFFWMLTMLVYLRYVRKPNWKPYCLMMFFFAMGLLSKPMVVTLPCVLLLWDAWPLRRPVSVWLIIEKLPLFALSVASGLWTSVVMRGGTVRHIGGEASTGERIANALVSYVVYLRKMVWPNDLAVLYPIDVIYDPTQDAIRATGLLLVLTLLAVCFVRSRPYLLVGWLWYLGTLLLVSLRLQAGSFTWADRYTYIPLIGIFIAIVWGLSDLLLNRSWGRAFLSALFSGVLLACLTQTWFQVRTWNNSETLWTQALKVTNNNVIAHVNLAFAISNKEGRLAEEIDHWEAAIRIKSDVADWHWKLGQARFRLATADPQSPNVPLVRSALASFHTAAQLFPERYRERWKSLHRTIQ